MGGAGEGFSIKNSGAATLGFSLVIGGLYQVSAHATWGGGNADLQILLPDGVTYLSMGSATKLTADGFATIYLPPGTYQVVITTSTAVYWAIARIPLG